MGSASAHYNYYRDYDSGIGRYVESDPIGIWGGFNTYGYGAGGPLRNSDSNGLQAAAAAPLLGTCGPVCWTGLVLITATAMIVTKCEKDKGPPAGTSPEREQKCKLAWQRCMADNSIHQDVCFKAYDECVKTNETFIFPGKGNRGNPVR